MTGKQHVAVLLGGRSTEREVSLVTGRFCARALDEAGYSTVCIDSRDDDLPATLRQEAPDTVFNALHGRFGEDGCIQGLLETLGLPYTHSGVLASALAMNKLMTKQIYRQQGLATPDDRAIATLDDIARCGMAAPYVIKPVNEGSSVGVVLVMEPAMPHPAALVDFQGRLMVEEYIPGLELTVSVLDGEPLAVTQIVSDGWYDYDAKYAEGGSRHILPAPIPAAITALALDMARIAHRALGCRGLTRTDFRWDDRRGRDGLFVLETNTQPGMTPTSLAPEQAAHCGITMPELCRSLVKGAACGN